MNQLADILEISELSGILDIVQPMRPSAGDILACEEIDFWYSATKNPYWKQGDSEDEKRIPPSELLKKRIEDGWKVITICWKRQDGGPNYGQAPTVNHRLVAVLVKVKKGAES